MNPEIQTWLAETLQQSKEFVLTQAPETVQQFLAFKSVSLGSWGLFWTSLGIVLTFLAYRSLKTLNSNSYGKVDEGLIFAVGGYSLVSFLSLAIGLDLLTDFVHVYFYPKSYLLSLLLRSGTQ